MTFFFLKYSVSSTFFFSWPGPWPAGSYFPDQRMEPILLKVEEQSFNLWTAREVPKE